MKTRKGSEILRSVYLDGMRYKRYFIVRLYDSRIVRISEEDFFEFLKGGLL